MEILASDGGFFFFIYDLPLPCDQVSERKLFDRETVSPRAKCYLL